ncbi:MAG: hypothetical protein U1B78_01545 [Dehalococcoidia bacterium]|nr:hypothetical protein [Dehalococcoidia bacterium]
MWSKFMEVKNGYAAQIWLEFFHAEGVAVQVVPPLEGDTPMMAPRELWVPDSKTHVAVELLRKI